MLAGVRERPQSLQSQFTGRWLATLTPKRGGAGRELASGAGKYLSLLMLDDGPEAHRSQGAGTAVVFEGVLHNRTELVEALRRPELTESQDAEIVRNCFERWGVEAAKRMKGSYSFLFWDSRSAQLVAVRDRTGICPLFYRRRGSDLYLSTSASAVAGTEAGGARIDRKVIAGFAMRRAPDIAETCYRGVKRVPAGNLLVFDRGGLRLERYWELKPIGEGTFWVTDEEIGEFPHLLERTVGRAFDPGKPGIFLSGGLDSVSVAIAAERNARMRGVEHPLALSLLFPAQLREEEIQRGVAGGLGLDQVCLEFREATGRKGIVAEALALSAGLDAPLQNIWLPAYLKLGRAGVERGCVSILNGRGGDEWLNMVPIVASDLMSTGAFRELFAHTLASVNTSKLGALAALRSVLWRNGAEPLLRAHYRALVGRLAPGLRQRRRQRGLERKLNDRPTWLLPDPALKRVVEGRSRQRLETELREAPLPPGGFRLETIRGVFDNSLFAPVFEENYETGRLIGAPQYDVYWDSDLIEFLYRVPPRLLNRGGQRKGLVRQDVARRFPGMGFERQKKLVARNFVNEVLLEEAGVAWQEIGGARALADLGVIEPKRLDSHFKNILSRRDTRRLGDLWLFLRLESWARPRV